MNNVLLAVRPLPDEMRIPILREQLRKTFPGPENEVYLRALEGKQALPQVLAQRLGALLLLPSLLDAVGVDSTTLRLFRDRNGRPYAEGAPTALDFNLSHSGGHIACALLTGGERVGIDVEEPVAPARAEGLLARFATDGERAWLAADPSADFTRLWTVREAISKQAGSGQPLRFDATCPPPGVRVLTARLSDTGASVALCIPADLPQDACRVHPDSLSLMWEV